MSVPDFGIGYPSGGERISLAWNAMWALLVDGEWHLEAMMVRRGADAGDVLEKTAMGLLYQARTAGFLQRKRMHGKQHCRLTFLAMQTHVAPGREASRG